MYKRQAISSFADGLYENIELSIQTRNHSSTLIFKGKNDIYVAPLIDTDEAYLCESVSYTHLTFIKGQGLFNPSLQSFYIQYKNLLYIKFFLHAFLLPFIR